MGARRAGYEDIEKIEDEKSKERMSQGGKGGLEEGTDTCPYLGIGETNIVGAKIGMSGRQYDRAKYVAKHATPEEKVEVLQHQLKEANGRAGDAESKLARQIELRNNDIYHYESTIEMQKNRIENLISRITELESLLSEEDENDLRS